MPVHTGRMLLTPQDPLLSVDTEALRRQLREVGFIGEPLTGGQRNFLAGKDFLSLVVFAGCSVQIELQPPVGGGVFCYVRIIGPLAHPTLLHGRNTRPPRCPACRAQHRDWRTLLLAAEEGPAEAAICSACGTGHPLWAWDWKGNAGFGKTFVSIEEIFPGEATPAPALSIVLERVSGTPWRHFYVQDS